MSMIKRALPILTTLCMIVSLVPSATAEMVDEELEIVYWPETVIMGPGGETTVTIVVTSHSDESMDVAFEFIPVDAPRRADGYFTTVFTTLGPGAEKKNELVVKSNAKRSDDEDVSNFVVVVYRGSEIQLDEDQRPLTSTVDGTWEHEFKVLFDPEPELGYLPVAIVLGLVVVIALVLYYPLLSKRLAKR
jgi:hypothetical protein